MKTLTVKSTKKKERSQTQLLLAQYFTPEAIAEYMSSLFLRKDKVSILDPGAGEGVLGLTLINHLSKDAQVSRATFIELDEPTYKMLEKNTTTLPASVDLNLINSDFIDSALRLEAEGTRFTHIILNPPYFKLKVGSESSVRLRKNGIHVTNIYAAFVWLSARLLEDNGELVAITPRSFCNGPYFLKFRQFLAEHFSVDTIHIFGSRNKAFAHDNVLQENIIIHLSKREQVQNIKLSYSGDQTFSDIVTKELPIQSIISPDDETKTIHIPSEKQALDLTSYLINSLQDLEISVSTGPVVDFRNKENIFFEKEDESIPLLYPSHMSGTGVTWPLTNLKKMGQYYKPAKSSNDFLPLGDDLKPIDRNVLPLDGYYVIVRRFSSKEEKRRIFASVIKPDQFSENSITFENHLNYFHLKKHGFDKDLAYGLCAYLNSTLLDEHFRKISGHTQVNVSDLKRIPYPDQLTLRKIGSTLPLTEEAIDGIVTKEILGATE